MKLLSNIGNGFGLWQKGYDHKIIHNIDMATIACGFHAGDPMIINESVKLSSEYKKSIGAHIGAYDKFGFGFNHYQYTVKEFINFTVYQLSALQGFCYLYNSQLDYIRFQGSFYFDIMYLENIFESVCKLISNLDKNISLVLMSTLNNNKYREIADKYGINILFEVFLDELYNDEGQITRNKETDLSSKKIFECAQKFLNENQIASMSGKNILMEADLLSINNCTLDSMHAISFVRKILNEVNIKK